MKFWEIFTKDSEVENATSQISGRVILKEIGVGIPNLLITVYDVDRRALPKEAFTNSGVEPGTDFWQKFQGDRLGSVLTDKNGQFELAYEDSEFRIGRDEKRPDLILIVTAPEEPGRGHESPVLYVSSNIRQNAARTENYIIGLTAEHLEKFGVPVPFVPTLEGEKIDERRRTVAQKRVEKERAFTHEFDEKIKQPLLKAISKVPDELVNPDSFVAPGESVEEKARKIIERGINEVVNTTTRLRRIA